MSISGLVHLEGIGDQYFTNSQFAGTRGQSRRLEGFTLNPPPGVEIEYMAHIQDRGDTHWYRGGEFCGSRGQSKRVEGIAVRLVGPSASMYDVVYTAHVEGMGDVRGRNGEFVGTRGQSRRVEGIEVRLEQRGYSYVTQVQQPAFVTQVQQPTYVTQQVQHSTYVSQPPPMIPISASIPPPVNVTFASFPTGPMPPPVVGILGHIQNRGDVSNMKGEFVGTRGQSLRLEGFQLTAPSGIEMEYMAHLQDRGDTHWHRSGEFCGTRGQSRRVEGIAIRLVGHSASMYDVIYTVHVEGVGDVRGRNGEFVGTRGQSRRVEGLEVRLEPRYTPPVVPVISVLVHIQNRGDVLCSGGEFAGTRGQSLRLEGFQLNPPHGIDVEYMAHLQDRGDTHWHRSGEFCGTRGQSKRVEGVAIRLVGPSANMYDITYTVHVEGMGDVQGRNGDFVGTRGQSRRAEGIQVKLVPRTTSYTYTETKVISPPYAYPPPGGYPPPGSYPPPTGVYPPNYGY